MAIMLMEILEEKGSSSLGLDAIETDVSQILREVRKRATEKILEEQDAVILQCCCGQAMKNKQKLPRTITGLATYTILRRSFYCPCCTDYRCPLDDRIQVTGRYSLEIKKAMTLFGQRMPFEESSDYIQKILHVEVSQDKIHRFVEGVGKKIAEDETKQTKKAVDETGTIKRWETKAKERAGVAYLQLDGSMVQTRKSGWKEVRLGLLFKEKDTVQPDKHHKLILNKNYFSVFNNGSTSLKRFKHRATQEAYDFHFHTYKYPVILADGAKWIWDYADLHHPYAIQILDYYHASEYLGEAWKSLKIPEDSTQKKTKKDLFDYLWNGQISPIITYLLDQKSTDDVVSCIRYFKNNQHRMRYKEYRNKSLDIGSGAIESAHRIVIQTRMKQSGMHWKKSNVQSIASLRSKYLSGQWTSIVEDYLIAA